MASYAVQLATRYDGLVIATFPDLPGVSALGMDDEEALDEARRALDAALRDFAAEGADAPEPLTSGPNMIEAAPVIALAV
jgi:predicted RNase H-like HicB family nuclease